MIIARAPLRISFAGGGTDLPAYYEPFGGMVVSTTVNKYVYVMVSANGPDAVHIASADYRTFYRHHWGTPLNWTGDLALPRAVLHEFNLERGISIFVASEVPPGTGLGSSGAVAVALIRGIAAFVGQSLTPAEVAALACRVELEKLQAPVGKQDQYAAAFGGLNAISFAREGVTVEPIRCPPGTIETLERRLLLFFTGTARNSSTILQEQQRQTARREGATLAALHHLKEAAWTCRARLEAGDVDGIGELLREGWLQKKRLTVGITNAWIDELYDVAISRGAIGGKIAGAGGGGFLLLYCREAQQEVVTEAMEQRGLRRMDLRFVRHGATTASVRWDADDVAAPDAGVAELPVPRG